MITVSGRIDPAYDAAVAGGRRPRADYYELARSFGADVMDVAEAERATGALGRLVGRLLGNGVVLAWACARRRKRYRLIFTDGEHVGFPYAALTSIGRARPRHVMVGHRLSPRKKTLIHRWLRLRRRIDTVVVYSSHQQRVAIADLGYPPDHVVLSPFMVDTSFWRSDRLDRAERTRPMICAAGQELRDYPTLVEAVRGLDVDVILAAASPWSKRADSSAGVEIPPNVVVTSLDFFDLRQLYANATLVVVPLEESDFQAGITTILEAMSMGKAVVCTRTTGQTDTLLDGATGLYVPPGDTHALRAAIERLIADPDTTARVGAAAREWAVEHADIAVYADRLAERTGPG